MSLVFSSSFFKFGIKSLSFDKIPAYHQVLWEIHKNVNNIFGLFITHFFTNSTWGAYYGCPGAEISAWVFWGVRPNSWTRPRCPPTWRWRLTTFLVGCGGQTHGCAEAHGRGLAVWPGPNISQCV